MNETGSTRGWFGFGLALILFGGGAYALLTLFGLQAVIVRLHAEVGNVIWPLLLIPGLVGLGFLVLLAKVIIDRLNSAEDDHYSNTVDK